MIGYGEVHYDDVPLLLQMHCELHYDETLQRYVITDHASQTGTFVNEKRLSQVQLFEQLL